MSQQTRPADACVAVTPSDSADISTLNGLYPRAIYVGVGGDVVIVGTDNVAVTFKNWPTGAMIPVRTRRVNSTSTTATNLVALY